MSEHWNIQIKIQRVQKEESQATLSKPNPILGTPRVIDELLNVAVTAGTEEEAYAKAHRILDANRSDPAIPIPVATQQQAPGRRA